MGKAWKRFERQVAEDFGAEGRTPLSSSASRHTASDTLHGSLYIEAKLMADAPLWDDHRDLRERARRYDRDAVIVLDHADRPGLVYVFDQDQGRLHARRWDDDIYRCTLAPIQEGYVVDHRVSRQLPYWRLVEETVDQARAEEKTPVVAVTKKGCPGYLVLLPSGVEGGPA